MWDALLICGSGLLGSAHCLGMCGGFVATIGAATPPARSNLARQLSYTFGRIFTYAFLGFVGGYGGHRLLAAPWWRGGQSLLAVVAGVVLISAGLRAMGWTPRWLRATTAGGGCSALGGFSTLLTSGRTLDVALAGLLTGFLPCGLVYAFLAVAIASGTPISGMLVMTLFGLGTAPAMIAAGCAMGSVGWRLRQRIWTLAACLVIVTGALSVARGVRASFDPTAPPCPFCNDSTADDRVPSEPEALSPVEP